MGNHALRKELNSLLKENNYPRLYSCNKRKAWKWLDSSSMHNMILFLKNVKIGTETHDYGVNQRVASPVNITYISCSSGKIASQVDQVIYESGYWGCGCGSYACFTYENTLKSKDKIIDYFKEVLRSENTWSNKNLPKQYFQLLEKGIDILTDDGFLISNYQKIIKENNL